MNVSSVVRERQLNVRLSPEEAALLDLLAKHYGLNGANVVRTLITQAARALASSPSKPAKRPRSKR
jgi:uncharacterized protein (DUF1778 family)